MKQLFKKKIDRKHLAFTLIELLIVIAVIGILVAVILPNLMGMRERARDTVRKNDLAQLKKALRLYFDDHGVYPPVSSSNRICCNLPSQPCTMCGFNFAIPGGETYMGGLPDGYRYYRSADGYRFILAIELENIGDQSILASQQRCQDSFIPIIVTQKTFVVCED